MKDQNHEDINRARWDERAPIHAASHNYRFHDFKANPNYISNVVDFDRPLLGDISGLHCVHLQCHIGTDTLSLSRLGAASATGLDFSAASLQEARKLAEATKDSGGQRLNFVEATVYDSLDVLAPGSFDLVFTGIGALCWIPSIKQWADIVAGLLKPGGRLFIREAHPILWALDDECADKLVVEFPYFETAEPTIFQDDSTYVETDGHKFKHTKSANFNHGIGEIVEALLSRNMRITGLVEHQSIPWAAIPAQMTSDHKGEFSLTDRPERLPLSYTLQAVKL